MNYCALLLALAPDVSTEVAGLARPLVDAELVPGICIGWIARDGDSGLVAVGRNGRDDARPMEPDAIFEIGSVTKSFTGLLLARAVARGELELGDPLAAVLPEELRPQDESVRLVDLATHTSGMPEIPTNLVRDMSRFVVDYSGYDREDLSQFLRAFRPESTPGETYVYSNVGFGVLGFALAEKAGVAFDELVTSAIIEPLELRSTGIRLDAQLSERLVIGHDPNGDPVEPMEFGALGGCGALRSNVPDLLLFARAFLDEDGPLRDPARLASHGAWRAPSGVELGLGWNLALDGNTWFHDGLTAGFAAFVSFDRKNGTAVVALANGSTPRVSEVGVAVLRHLLGIPVSPPTARIPAAVESSALKRLAGDYDSRFGFTVHVTSEEDRLYARVAGQPRYRLFPQSERSFFYRTIEATVDFESEGAGPADVLVLHQNGRDYRCARSD